MAAPQVAGGPVSAEPAPEPMGLDEALSSYEAPAEDEAGEGDEGAPEAEAAPAAAPEVAADPFSEAALAAPGGIANAQKLLKQKQQDHDRAYLKLSNRERAFKQTRDQHIAELNQTRAYVQAVQADVNLLANGDASQKLDALGRLTRRDGLKVWEELAIGAAGGKKAPPAPEVVELREQLAQLTRHLQAEREQQQEHATVQQLHQLKTQMLQGATNAEQYPALAHFASAKPAEVMEQLNEYIVEAHASGRPITWQQAYNRLNSELSEYYQPAASAAVAPTGAGGLATSVAQAAKPVQPTQRSPGRSLNPSLATRATSSVREMTEAERIAELASDPDFMASLGFG